LPVIFLLRVNAYKKELPIPDQQEYSGGRWKDLAKHSSIRRIAVVTSSFRPVFDHASFLFPHTADPASK